MPVIRKIKVVRRQNKSLISWQVICQCLQQAPLWTPSPSHTQSTVWFLSLENVTGPWMSSMTGRTQRTGDLLAINKISPPAAAVQLWGLCTLFSRVHSPQTSFSHPLSKGTFFAHKPPSKYETLMMYPVHSLQQFGFYFLKTPKQLPLQSDAGVVSLWQLCSEVSSPAQVHIPCWHCSTAPRGICCTRWTPTGGRRRSWHRRCPRTPRRLSLWSQGYSHCSAGQHQSNKINKK